MEKSKFKIKPIKVKSFVTNPKTTDHTKEGGYTWVG